MLSRTWVPRLIRICLAFLLASSLSAVDGYQTVTPQVTGYQNLQGRRIVEAAAGTTIVIVGTNLGTSGSLDFNGRAATPTQWTPTALTVVVPPANSYPTNGTVRLTTAGVTIYGPPFSILAPPSSPAPSIFGYRAPDGTALTSAIPGTALVIVGANLGSSGTLSFNGIPATATTWSATAITTTVPTAASYPNTGPVRVTTAGRTATGPNFTITALPPAPPSVTGYRTPTGSAVTSAVPGTAIVIVGANLGTTGTVTFNGIAAAPSNWTATAITVTVPNAPGYPNTGPVRVTTGEQTAAGPDFTITAPPAPPPPPLISGYRAMDGTSPTSGIPGTSLVIEGTNLGTGGTVSFNGISATVSDWTATAVTVLVPAAPAYPHSGPVTITTGGETAVGPDFTITAPPPPVPSISGYRTTSGSPITSAAAGTTIAIGGANLGSGGTVSFNGIAAAPITWTSTAITVAVPNSSSYPNTGPVQVMTGGQSATGPEFTITEPAAGPPAISGYRLLDGRTIREVAAGTTIVIVGTNLGTSGSLDFNGRAATPTQWTPTALTVVVPPAFSYPTNGTVRLTTGGVTVYGPPFTLLAPPPAPPPSISGYRATDGTALTSAVHGTSIVIVGANLGSAGTLSFNGIPATAITWSATAITATVPAAASYPSTGPVRVTTAGRTATGPNFTITGLPSEMNLHPTVTIDSPATGSSFVAPATVTLDASASDADGTVARVEWYQGATLLETDLAPPYSLTWSSSTPSPYTFTAKAIDNAGAFTVSNSVTIYLTGSDQTIFKIMPFGDSLTYGTLSGGGTTGGYRPTLWRMLEASGFRIDFVGSLSSGFPFVPDPHNEGRPGWTTQAALNLIRETFLNLLGTHQPDVVLLMLGTNDVYQNLPDAPSRLGSFLDEVARQLPNATTIVAGIIPIRDKEAQAIAYNQAVAGQVSQRQAAGQRVRYFDMYPVVSVSELPDGVHPTDSAYSNMGAAWFQALVPVLTGG